MAASQNYVFRRAEKEDIKAVRSMIQDLADFENMSDGPEINEADLIRDAGLDGGKEYCHIYVLELQKQEKSAPLIIGYSICFFSYSTWQGKTYFMEDLYVHPDYRGLGAGARMFRELAGKAQQYGCKRLDFHALSWNPACEFYKKMGALDLTTAEQWHFFRLQEQQMAQLTQQLL